MRGPIASRCMRTSIRSATLVLLAAILAAGTAIAERRASHAAASPNLGAELRQLVQLRGGPPGAIANTDNIVVALMAQAASVGALTRCSRRPSTRGWA
jgi:hypothetical protein